MKDFPQLGLENIRAIPSGIIEGVQRDLIRDPSLRRKIVSAIISTNLKVELAILTGAQSLGQSDMSPDEAYAFGAYTIIGALMATNETAALGRTLAGEMTHNKTTQKTADETIEQPTKPVIGTSDVGCGV